MHLQERIRKILIEALNHLDLQDPSTLEAMKAALFYVASLCQRLNEKYSSSSATVAKTPARMQWLELKCLLAHSGLKGLVLDVQGQAEPNPLPSAANTQDQMKVEAETVRTAALEGEHEPTRCYRSREYFKPSATIKALSTVSEGTPVKLMCSECPFSVESSWYFQHPKTLKKSVISPQRGHNTCQQKVKNCYWKNLDGISVIPAHSAELQYCQHNRLLKQCAACGGYKMCIHAKRRHQCKECKHLPVGRRGPKRFLFRAVCAGGGGARKESMATVIPKENE